MSQSKRLGLRPLLSLLLVLEAVEVCMASANRLPEPAFAVMRIRRSLFADNAPQRRTSTEPQVKATPTMRVWSSTEGGSEAKEGNHVNARILRHKRHRKNLSVMKHSSQQSTVSCSEALDASEFILQLDEQCSIRVIRQLLPETGADDLLRELPGEIEGQLSVIGSRKSTIYFENPQRDYLFSGRRWSMDENRAIPPAILRVQQKVCEVASEPFNGAVVNVYDTQSAQIKWHDDGEYGVGPTVASFSLGRTAVMGFRRKRGKRKKGQWGQRIDLARDTCSAPSPPSPARSLSAAQSGQEAPGALPVVEARADATGVVRLEVRHNTLVVMEEGVQDSWEHRIFKPLPQQITTHQGESAAVDPRINLTFHVHL